MNEEALDEQQLKENPFRGSAGQSIGRLEALLFVMLFLVYLERWSEAGSNPLATSWGLLEAFLDVVTRRIRIRRQSTVFVARIIVHRTEPTFSQHF